MGCIPSREKPNSETPLLEESKSEGNGGKKSVKRAETLQNKSNAKKPTITRRNTLDRIDLGGSYDNMGNYRYKRWCGIRRSTCLLSIYVTFYMIYILFGAIVMVALEEENLKNQKHEAVSFKRDFMLKHHYVNETELEEFIAFILDRKESGVSVLDKDLEEQEWIFGEGIFFVVTLLTTIGSIKPISLTIMLVIRSIL